MSGKVSTILQRKGSTVETVARDITLERVAQRLAALGIGAVVVVDDAGRPVGLCSERDVVRALADGGLSALSTTVGQLGSGPLAVCRPDTDAEQVMATMTEQRVRHVPVVDDGGALVGIVSIGDLVKWRIDELDADRAHLTAYVSGATY